MKTTLYVKTHNKTGLKYFGKVSGNRNPYTYNGSGKYWKRHLRLNGTDISTEIVGVFDSIDECSRTANKFSVDNDIVNSSEWANLRIENGVDGAPVGHVGSQPSDAVKRLVGEQSRLRWANPLYREKVVASHRKRWTVEKRQKQSTRLRESFWTDERKASHSAKMTGNPGYRGGKGKPKPTGFGGKISKARRGIPHTAEHVRKSAYGQQCDKRVLVDHLGAEYPIHLDFTKKYNIDYHHFYNLDSRIRIKSSYIKLGIDYEANKMKTKRELGFRFT